MEGGIEILVPVAGAAQHVEGRVAAWRALPSCDLIGDAGLDDRRLVIELSLALHTHDGPREPLEGALVRLETPGESEVHPHHIGEQGKAPLARLEIAHPGQQGIAVFHDLEEVLIDIGGVTARRDVAIDVDHPAIGGEADLPLVGGRRWLDIGEVGGDCRA
jgi:hypothetical protein